VSADPFLGTLYAEAYDEQVRPRAHAPSLCPFTGTYEIIVDAYATLEAPSKKALHADVLARLEAASMVPSDEAEARIRATGVSPGAPTRQDRRTLLEGTPAYAWFAMHKEPAFHAALLDASTDPHAALPTPPSEPPKRKPRLKHYDVRYSLLFECARELWARDTEHAELVLQQDVAVLLNVDCLDRWTDDQVGYGWHLGSITVAEDAE
jgi:hypothetical protein